MDTISTTVALFKYKKNIVKYYMFDLFDYTSVLAWSRFQINRNVSNIKDRCGMLANKTTINQRSNEVDTSLYR